VANVETQVANNVQMQGFMASPFTNSGGCKEGKISSNPKRLTNHGTYPCPNF
jgi:hypothetical protein